MEEKFSRKVTKLRKTFKLRRKTRIKHIIKKVGKQKIFTNLLFLYFGFEIREAEKFFALYK